MFLATLILVISPKDIVLIGKSKWKETSNRSEMYLKYTVTKWENRVDITGKFMIKTMLQLSWNSKYVKFFLLITMWSSNWWLLKVTQYRLMVMPPNLIYTQGLKVFLNQNIIYSLSSSKNCVIVYILCNCY